MRPVFVKFGFPSKMVVGIRNIVLLTEMLWLYCFLYHKPMETDYIITIFIPFIWESQYMQKAKMVSKSFLGGHFYSKIQTEH